MRFIHNLLLFLIICRREYKILNFTNTWKRILFIYVQHNDSKRKWNNLTMWVQLENSFNKFLKKKTSLRLHWQGHTHACSIELCVQGLGKCGLLYFVGCLFKGFVKTSPGNKDWEGICDDCNFDISVVKLMNSHKHLNIKLG